MSSWLSSLGDTIKNSAEDLTRGVQGKETGRAESVVVTFEGSALGLTVSDHGGEGVLSALAPGGEAERLGLKLGDRVVAVGGAPTFKYPDVVDAIRSRPDRPLQLNLERRSASEGQLGLVTFRLDEECDKAPARRPSTRAVLAPRAGTIHATHEGNHTQAQRILAKMLESPTTGPRRDVLARARGLALLRRINQAWPPRHLRDSSSTTWRRCLSPLASRKDSLLDSRAGLFARHEGGIRLLRAVRHGPGRGAPPAGRLVGAVGHRHGGRVVRLPAGRAGRRLFGRAQHGRGAAVARRRPSPRGKARRVDGAGGGRRPRRRSFSEGGAVSLGAQLGAVAGPIGASREASVAAQPSAAAPVFTYSLSRGLFAGVSLEGSSINERNSVNERHYQRVGVRASELLQGLVPPRPAARGLLSALDALDAADGAVVSPQPAPPAYSDNNPFS